MSDRPTKQRSFFWQGVLILLPVVVLVVVGAVSLRQDRILAENDARDRCAQVAESLAATLSKDLYSHAVELVTEIRIASSLSTNRQSHFSKPAWFPREKIESYIAAPLYDELVKNWNPRNTLAQGRIIVDLEGRLYDETGQSARPISTEPEPHILDAATLTPEQAAAWQQARDAEFQPGSSSNGIAAIESFLTLSPPPLFAAQARYTLALFKAQSGDATADALFRELESLPDAVTENGAPIRILAAWQRLQHSPHPTDADMAALCSNALAQPCFYTPLILQSIDARESRLGGGGRHAAQAIFQWEAEEARRQFLNQHPQILSNIVSRKSAWMTWGRDRWIAAIVPVRGEPQSKLPPARFHIFALNELLLREAAWELVIRSRAALPDYAEAGVTLLQQPLLEPQNSGQILAQASADWMIPQAAIPGLAVRIHLAQPRLLYAHQRQRSWLIAAIILSAALVAVMGFYKARRAFQEQLRLNELKSNFVSAVSHELRAPIASVRLLAEGLDRGKIIEPGKQKEYFQFIVQECRRLSSLIENVLDFSRIEQGRKRYEFEPADMLALARQTVQLLTPNAQERQVPLRLDESQLTPGNAPFTCDSLAIQQALINLIDNALKHSPGGSEVVVGILQNGEDELRLWVQDHGPGIPASEQEKIFERFYRLGSELRRQTQGVGIGLAIVKHIVEGHGGRVRVESEPGRGSRFTIELRANAIPSHIPR